MPLGSKASDDFEKRASRLKFFMLIEDTYMHYIYDPRVYLTCIWALGKNVAKTPKFNRKWPSSAFLLEMAKKKQNAPSHLPHIYPHTKFERPQVNSFVARMCQKHMCSDVTMLNPKYPRLSSWDTIKNTSFHPHFMAKDELQDHFKDKAIVFAARKKK